VEDSKADKASFLDYKSILGHSGDGLDYAVLRREEKKENANPDRQETTESEAESEPELAGDENSGKSGALEEISVSLGKVLSMKTPPAELEPIFLGLLTLARGTGAAKVKPTWKGFKLWVRKYLKGPKGLLEWMKDLDHSIVPPEIAISAASSVDGADIHAMTIGAGAKFGPTMHRWLANFG